MRRRPVLAVVAALVAALVTGAWTSSTPDDMWSDGGYVIHNNMWNADGYDVRQTLRARAYHDWEVTTTADNRRGDGAVKTYPNVHKDFHNWSTGAEPRVSAFARIRARYAARSPHVGIYNMAFDVWLNGVPGNREVMIWTENHKQVPAGRVVARGVSFAKRSWTVYATADNHYIAFVPTKAKVRGFMPIKRMIRWTMKRGLVPAASTLGQVCFGVEVVSTGGKPATFRFTDFELVAVKK